MDTQINRRRFLHGAAIGGAGLVILRGGASARGYQANERLNVALVGVGGRGRWFVETMPKMSNVVALCDVNERKITEALGRWKAQAAKFATSERPWEKSAAKEYARLLANKPKTHADFRKMLDETGKEIDAVVVSIPDHTHAVASAAAIKAGKHVFCEKPLTRTVHESRALRELARKHKVATAMGNQGTASGQFRRALELIRDGTIGEVKEVHVWNTGGGADKKAPPKGTEAVPRGLNWDLWLGPAAERPFHRQWMRRNAWRDFGTCQLGNWASHTANLAFMALKVHSLWLDAPPKDAKRLVRVEAKCAGINTLSFPRWEVVRWEIPSRAEFPPITITWHNGAAPGSRQRLEGLIHAKGDTKWSRDFAGAIIVGAKGTIHSTGHNATFRLLPEKEFRDVDRSGPKTVDRSRGHERDWLLACKGGKPAWSNFDYADALNEFLMLGNVATQFEGKLDFDPQACKIVNNPAADKALRSEYRKGWSL